jgi:hypothetical protein
MIHSESEELISFAQLAARLPRRRRGRPVHVSTISRWRNPGLRGIKLEAVRIGGTWATSMAAFHRFCSQLADSCGDGGCADEAAEMDESRGHKRAEAELNSSGWN